MQCKKLNNNSRDIKFENMLICVIVNDGYFLLALFTLTRHFWSTVHSHIYKHIIKLGESIILLKVRLEN